MKYDAFICYRGEGSGGEFAVRLYAELNKLDYLSFFFAPRGVSHGQDFLEKIDRALAEVHVVILILTKGFFEKCKMEDDVVRHELKTAAADPRITFLPIAFPGFDFSSEDLSPFTNEEISRFKHQSAIPYSGIYDTFISEKIVEDVLALLEKGQSVEALKIRSKSRYRDAAAEKELDFLRKQTEMLLEYDRDVYERILTPGMSILDLGCNEGSNTMARFGEIEGVKLIGIDRDEGCIQSANEMYGDRASFFSCDIEDASFSAKLAGFAKECGIAKFDLINISMVLLHMENPFRLFKAIRPYLAPNGTVFIRDIDDDFNFAFPDTEGIFSRMTGICSYCDILGYRKSGKELYAYLKRSGFSRVRIEKSGFDTSAMSYDEREALFDIYFGYIPTALEKTMESNPENFKIRKDYEWVKENLDRANQLFQQNDFLFSLGYIIYTARL